MNEAVKIGAWITMKMLADDDARPFIGDEVHQGVAPRGPRPGTTVFVYYKFVSDDKVTRLGRRRKNVRTVYDIAAWALQEHLGDLKVVVDSIDAVFSDVVNEEWQGWIFSSSFEGILSSEEMEEKLDRKWIKLGASYRISAYMDSI